MKKEIDFIDVEGFYGGSQRWMPKEIMRLGGCSSICAGEICAVLKKNFGRKYICTIDTDMMTKEFFVSFCCVLFKYIYPRKKGVDTTALFVKSFKDYLCFAKAQAEFTEFSGENYYDDAKDFIIKAID